MSRRRRARSSSWAARLLPLQADVRSIGAVRDAVNRAEAEFNGLGIVVAQAKIDPLQGTPSLQAWSDGVDVDVDLIGSIDVIQAALPHLEGASVIATASTAAIMQHGIADTPDSDPGGAGYAYAKRALAKCMHELVCNRASLKERVAASHPTNCNTQMLRSEPTHRSFRPDLEPSTRQDTGSTFVRQAMPIPFVELVAISNMALFLTFGEARHIAGVRLRMDSGGCLKRYDRQH
ncbi:SDR family NAD(P)-dependent oxidoreductase [Streptomyces sp. 8P21H-1]|uniref:SDR family NAD(P)-dependent oxidoreductase n=1 Tax=Streptomyces sp. 8P21H-1 TaxID=2737048 RepID=UPI0034A07A09